MVKVVQSNPDTVSGTAVLSKGSAMAIEENIHIEGESSPACTFCGGTGTDPFGLLYEASRCQVCGGKGRITLYGPVIPCAYCRGTGVHPQRRLTCTVCDGKGMVETKGPVETCPDCTGKGFQQGQYLPCLTCGGRGVVTKV